MKETKEPVQEPQAVSKLLHNRAQTSSPGCRNNRSSVVADGEGDVLSKYWEERRRKEKNSRKPPVPNILPYKYHAEPIITKIAFRSK